MISKIKPLFIATATNTGGRNGHSETTDGWVSADLSVRKEMGGPGKPGTTTPEHLFAAGYAACFGGALDFVAKNHKKNATGAAVTCAVSIGPREAGGFGLAVKMTVVDRSLPTAELKAFVEEAHERSARIRMRRATISRSIFRSRAHEVRAASKPAKRSLHISLSLLVGASSRRVASRGSARKTRRGSCGGGAAAR